MAPYRNNRRKEKKRETLKRKVERLEGAWDGLWLRYMEEAKEKEELKKENRRLRSEAQEAQKQLNEVMQQTSIDGGDPRPIHTDEEFQNILCEVGALCNEMNRLKAKISHSKEEMVNTLRTPAQTQGSDL